MINIFNFNTFCINSLIIIIIIILTISYFNLIKKCFSHSLRRTCWSRRSLGRLRFPNLRLLVRYRQISCFWVPIDVMLQFSFQLRPTAVNGVSPSHKIINCLWRWVFLQPWINLLRWLLRWFLVFFLSRFCYKSVLTAFVRKLSLKSVLPRDTSDHFAKLASIFEFPATNPFKLLKKNNPSNKSDKTNTKFDKCLHNRVLQRLATKELSIPVLN